MASYPQRQLILRNIRAGGEIENSNEEIIDQENRLSAMETFMESRRLTIKTYQAQENAPLHTQAEAQYVLRKGTHYLFYEEALEGFPAPFQSQLKIKDGCVELKRTGATTMRMVFETGKSYTTQYSTPYGEFFFEVVTERILFLPSEQGFRLELYYRLENAGEKVDDYRVVFECTSPDET